MRKTKSPARASIRVFCHRKCAPMILRMAVDRPRYIHTIRIRLALVRNFAEYFLSPHSAHQIGQIIAVERTKTETPRAAMAGKYQPNARVDPTLSGAKSIT